MTFLMLWSLLAYIEGYDGSTGPPQEKGSTSLVMVASKVGRCYNCCLALIEATL